MKHWILAYALVLSPLTAHAQTRAEWPVGTLAATGADPTPVAKLLEAVASGVYGNIDHIVIVRDGRLVVDERYARNYVEISRGRSAPLGCGVDACASPADVHQYNYLHPDFHPWWQKRNLHTLQSITKSVAATVVGAAIHQGALPGVDTPLVNFLDAYDLSSADPRLRQVTLRHVLTMQSGIEWHESDRPMDDTNTTLQLERSEDWIRFTLAQPFDAEPGTRWVYNSGGSQLLSEVIRSATGVQIDTFAARVLFAPLGIDSFHWKRTPTDHPDTEGGLYLDARDLARVGQLYLDDGVWNGIRLLPVGWAREATSRHVPNTTGNPSSPGYGYQWWRYDRRGAEIWAGNGFGGQFLVIIPAARMVAVVNSWNVFGDRVSGILGPLLEALLDSAGI